MSPAPVTLPEPAVDARETAPAAPRWTRPLYWSVRRELWENRSIHLAPLGVATFVVVALAVHGLTMPSHLRGMLGLGPGAGGFASIAFRGTAMLMLAAMFVTAAVYCMDALSGERRDRSILFWKSLPVSDLVTVLAKASVPLVVLPLVTFAAIAAMHAAMLLLGGLALLVQGQAVAPLWGEAHLFRLWLALLYGLAALSLWYAPIYALLLLVSGWARRTPGLWVVLPVLAAAVLEKLTMDTLHVAGWVAYALTGWYTAAFAPAAREAVMFDPQTALTPARFLATPSVWLGLALAAVLIAAAVRVRRSRGPG